MYRRDQNICNFNTVNYGISFCVELSQNQVDLLIKVAKEDNAIKIDLLMILNKAVRSPITFLSDKT